LAHKIVRTYGSPVYIYSENILRERCRDLLEAFENRVKPSYSVKANSNLALLKIIREEGIGADAMSPGEIFILEKAGFTNKEIFYIGNNVSEEEMQYCIDRDILVSVDSLSQLDTFGRINRGGRVAVRFNPGLGAGHCDKVVTAGHNTKFGVQPEFYPQVKELLKKHDLTLAGINQHIGSLFLDPDPYVNAAEAMLDLIARHFQGLEFIDFGGGFGVPYKPSEQRLDFSSMKVRLFRVLDSFIDKYDNKNVHFKCEPGRYISAECGVLVGTVHSLKENYGVRYVGTDIGFNVLMRHVLYGSYHEITVLGTGSGAGVCGEVTVVGNICESGDILANDRNIGAVRLGDLIAVSNAGAYGYSMSSNYNCRLRPAEVLVKSDGNVVKIRSADTLESLTANF
jgi:diaminopimelate decarboxylase